MSNLRELNDGISLSHCGHFVNWYERTQQTLSFFFPRHRKQSTQFTHALSLLLLESLPSHLSQAILNLLPNQNAETMTDTPFKGIQFENSQPRSYKNFVEKISDIINNANQATPPRAQAEVTQISKKIADFFLWAVTQQFPVEIKTQFQAALPGELRYRMDLVSDVMDDAKVA
jgi:hypothetical protein